jgi:hypothetical protein
MEKVVEEKNHPKFSHLRNLQSLPKWVIATACSEYNAYTYTSNPDTITRKYNNGGQENYLQYQHYGADNQPIYYNFIIDKYPASMIWQVLPKNIDDGGLFFGMCAYDGRDKNFCYNNDISQTVYFNGIAILYFGDNCYHIDQYMNNDYWNTPRSCLSKFELTKMIFTFQMTYSPSYTRNANIAYLSISYDGFEYYSRQNIKVKIDDLVNKYLYFVNPCVYMFSPGTQVEIRYSKIYPPTS